MVFVVVVVVGLFDRFLGFFDSIGLESRKETYLSLQVLCLLVEGLLGTVLQE